jgi:PAS domain S-box-containing protein
LATILIIDDVPANRDYLVTLLGYGGHDLHQAADGAEGLELVRAVRPDLVIADVLMPTMDGYEFVRRLRAEPEIAATPVIFYTAHYHEREARSLAASCGVTQVLTKPCEPEEVLRTVQAALDARDPDPPRAPDATEFDREHVRLMTNKLSRAADELRIANDRLTALIELGLRFGYESEPQSLLQGLCDGGREIIGARSAMLCVFDKGDSQVKRFVASGMAAEIAVEREAAAPGYRQLWELVEGRQSVRLRWGEAALPADFPPFQSLLAAPVMSLSRSYGWLCLLDRVGAEEFSEHDERLAGILAAQLGRIYENGSLYADLRRHASNLDQEVQERRRAEQDLERFFSQSLNLLCFAGFDGRVHRVNPAWQRTLGYTDEELLSRSLLEGIVHEEDREAAVEVLRSLSEGIELNAFEIRCRCKDGSYRWILWNAAPSLDRGGFYATGRDITGRKLAEQALAEREERIRLLLESTAEAIYGVDLEGNCIFANPACARLLGYGDPGELIGKNMHALIHYKHSDGRPYAEVDCPTHRARLQGEGVHVVDEVFWQADGSKLEVEYWSFPMRTGGESVGAVVTFWDISERKRLEAQLRQAQKLEAMGRLAGGIAHDFNNMLAVIGGYSELLLSNVKEDGLVRQGLAEIHRAGERGAALTRQLLIFSRKELIRPQLLDLNEVVVDTHKLLRRLIGEHIEFVTVVNTTPCCVRADAGHLEQVLMNLAVNARDAMPDGGKLTVRTANADLDESIVEGASAGPYVVLSVSDDGTGMDEQTRAHAFEPFFTTKAAGVGTGLGLATVHSIVEQTGGRINVESEPGKGTTFRIYLPREAGCAATAVAQSFEALPGGSETILLVEDEDMVRRLVRSVLERGGYRVVEAMHGEEALRVAEQHDGPIHLLLTDVVMPALGGRELAELLQASRPDIRVLFMSGYTDDLVLRHGLEAGTSALLEKPFTAFALSSKVREVLDSPS